MYNEPVEAFEKMLRGLRGQEPGVAGLLTRQVLALSVPEALVLDVGEVGVSCTIGDGKGTALLFPVQDDDGYLRYNVWLSHPAWRLCGVEFWARGEDLRICLGIIHHG